MRMSVTNLCTALVLMGGLSFATPGSASQNVAVLGLVSAPSAAERPADQQRGAPSALERERRYAGLTLGDAIRQSLIDDDLDFAITSMSALAQANGDAAMGSYFNGVRAFARSEFAEASSTLARADTDDMMVASVRTWSLVGENKLSEAARIWDAYGDSGRKPFYASYRALLAEKAGQRDVALRNYQIARSTGELVFMRDLAKRYAALLVQAGRQREALSVHDDIFGDVGELSPPEASFRQSLVARRPLTQNPITPQSAVSGIMTNYATAGMVIRMFAPSGEGEEGEKPTPKADTDALFVSDAMMLRTALLINPDNFDARFALADMFTQMDEDEAAQRTLEAISTGPRLNDARLKLASVQIRLEDPGRGAATLNSIPVADRDGDWWDTMGEALLSKGRYQEALSAVERSVQLAKGRGEWGENISQLSLATALTYLDRRPEANVIAQALLTKLQPDNPLRGAAGEILLDTPELRETGRAAVRQSLNAVGANGRSKVAVGAALMSEPETRNEGVQLMRDGLAEFPRSATLMNALGYYLVRYDIDLEEGFRLLQKALDAKPNSGSIMDSLGRAHYKLGNLDEAQRLIEGSLVALKDRVDPEVHDNLGDVYWHQGRKDDARAQWRRAQEIGGAYDGLSALGAKIRDGLTTPPPTRREVPIIAEPGSV
jgi:tetratricopeptide (TPR) repeat protein